MDGKAWAGLLQLQRKEYMVQETLPSRTGIWHNQSHCGMDRFPYVGLVRNTVKAFMTFMAMNLKRAWNNLNAVKPSPLSKLTLSQRINMSFSRHMKEESTKKGT